MYKLSQTHQHFKNCLADYIKRFQRVVFRKDIHIRILSKRLEHLLKTVIT